MNRKPDTDVEIEGRIEEYRTRIEGSLEELKNFITTRKEVKTALSGIDGLIDIPEKPVRIGIFGAKGGTGKTTIALSTAILLVKLGYRVHLLDYDLSTCGLSRLMISRDPVENDDPRIPSAELAAEYAGFEEQLDATSMETSGDDKERKKYIYRYKKGARFDLADDLLFTFASVYERDEQRAWDYFKPEERAEKIIRYDILLGEITKAIVESAPVTYAPSFMIFDTPAGLSSSLDIVLPFLDYAIVVSECDALSYENVNTMLSYIERRKKQIELKDLKTIVLFNKVSEDDIRLLPSVLGNLREKYGENQNVIFGNAIGYSSRMRKVFTIKEFMRELDSCVFFYKKMLELVRIICPDGAESSKYSRFESEMMEGYRKVKFLVEFDRIQQDVRESGKLSEAERKTLNDEIDLFHSEMREIDIFDRILEIESAFAPDSPDSVE